MVTVRKFPLTINKNPDTVIGFPVVATDIQATAINTPETVHNTPVATPHHQHGIPAGTASDFSVSARQQKDCKNNKL